MVLEERKYTAKEMAEFFGVQPASFSNRREKFLEELKRYCDYEDNGRKGIFVTKVHIEEYAGKTRKIVERDFQEAWQENPNSLKYAADYIYEKNRTVLTVKPITVYNTTCSVKREWYGIPKKKRGTKGQCNWVMAVVDRENRRFRYLTEEEKEIRGNMLHHFFKDEGERIEEVKALQKSLQAGELTQEEYIKLSDEVLGIAENGKWDEFNEAFMKAIGEECDFALELIDLAW